MTAAETIKPGPCPKCGWPIADGTVSHVCPTEPLVTDEGGYTSSVTFGPFDIVVSKRSDIG